MSYQQHSSLATISAFNVTKTLTTIRWLQDATTIWSPKASERLTWQWQLQGEIDLAVTGGIVRNYASIDMFDIDLFDVPETVIEELHAQGKIVVCYFSAGTYEAWRPDWAIYFDFLETDVSYEGSEPPFAGKLNKWDERWLDIRELDLLQPIMTARMELAASKGCDAVEPDNVDAYQNGDETGIPLTTDDQLVYNKWIADTAHGLGLAVGLKNDLDQLADLVNDFDFAVNEQCFQYDECDAYTDTFVAADKAVFGVEYSGSVCAFCPKAEALQLSWMKKRLDLRAYRQGCDDLTTRLLCWWSFLLHDIILK
jgi:hypothetical protein